MLCTAKPVIAAGPQEGGAGWLRGALGCVPGASARGVCDLGAGAQRAREGLLGAAAPSAALGFSQPCQNGAGGSAGAGGLLHPLGF